MTHADFARFYQAQFASYQEDLPYWLRLAERSGPNILELGCGSGRLLLPLLQKGYLVAGVERDRSMILRARRAVPPGFQSGLTLIQADFRNLGLVSRFDLAIMACNTFSNLDPGQAFETLERIRSALHDRGMLAMELPNPNPATWEIEDDDSPIDTFVDHETGNAIQVYCLQQCRSTTTEVRVVWRFDELYPNGRVQTHRIETVFNLWEQALLSRELRRAGFSQLEYFGDFDMSPFQDHSPSMLVCASNT